MMTFRLEEHEPSAPVQGLRGGRQCGLRMASNDRGCPKHCTKASLNAHA